MASLARAVAGACLILLLIPTPAFAGWDLLLFIGRAYPRLDDRLRFEIPPPSIANVDVTTTGDPVLQGDGGLTLGGALTVEAGVLGLEGRLDSVEMAFDVAGARFDLEPSDASLSGISGSLTLADGRLDLRRLNILSGNLRVRTPGPVGVVFSGGVSYLPRFEVQGSVPITVAVDTPIGGLSVVPRLGLEVLPEDDGGRVGLNAGAGLRVGAGNVAFVGEARVFAFREYELRFVADADDDLDGLVDELVGAFDTVRVRPVIVTAQGGLLIRF